MLSIGESSVLTEGDSVIMSATYRVSHYQAISKIESEHFWFAGRGTMLTALVERFIPIKGRRTFLEVGCGTGIVLRLVQMMGFAVTGLDVNETALMYAKAQCPHAHLIRQSLYTYQSPRRYQTIGAFEVLEHQAQDVLFLKRCFDLLEDDGLLFLTVPAGTWLWSHLDVLSGHKRRYEQSDLRDKLQRAGFHVLFSNYWNVLTLPWYMLYRMFIVRQKSAATMDMYLRTPNVVVNKLLEYLLRLERAFFFRCRFPFGATLVICAKKSTS